MIFISGSGREELTCAVHLVDGSILLLVKSDKEPGAVKLLYATRNTIYELLDELWYHSCISSIRILTAAKHVEVTHAVSVKSIMTSVLFCPLLITTLGYRIRREQIALHTFLLWQIWLITIN